MIIPVQHFTRESVKGDRKTNYLFTDNANRKSGSHGNLVINDVGETWYTRKYGNGVTYPGGSQAVIRGLENAFPISTMKAEYVQWEEEDFEQFAKVIDDEIDTIKKALKQKSLKVSMTRKIGRGRFSKLPDRHQAYLDKKLLEIGIDNSGDGPTLCDQDLISADTLT